MTPKTQSVCKHCHEKIFRAHGSWQTSEGFLTCMHNKSSFSAGHEPVAEPASTGEPPLDFHNWLTRVHGFKVGTQRNSYKESDLEAAWNAGISHRPEVIGAKPLCLDCHEVGIINCSHFDNCGGKWVYVAARPSEPSAPQMEHSEEKSK